MPTILIVDDRPSNREYLVTLLGYGGHRLLEAGDGAEGLATAKTVHCDLVIADILMPTMDGYEFVRQLRADPALAGTPVIFYTAHYLEHEARALANACGVLHVLTKPCEPEVVLRTVDDALGVAPPAAASPPHSEFDREHLRLLTDKLSQKADELRNANERLSALVDLGLQLGSERDVHRLLPAFGHSARKIIGARFGLVGILHNDGRQLRYCIPSGMDSATAARLGSPDPRQGVLETILKECRCVRLRNPGGDPAVVGLPDSFPPVTSFLGAPIVSPTRVYGWLCLIDKLGLDEFSGEDERLSGILAAQVGRIYENGSLYADMLRHSYEMEREVAERKRAVEELQQARRRLQHVISSSPAVLYTLALKENRVEQISWISENVEQLLGCTAQDAISPTWWLEHIHPEDRDAVVAVVNRELFDRDRVANEYRFRHRDGKYRWLRSEMRLVRNTAGEPVEAIGSWSDITGRKLLEDQFRQSQKMEAVARLAGGVAHDFNNLLTVINGYGEMVLEKVPAENAARELVHEIIAAGNRAAGLTRQLLAFSRKAILKPEILDIGEVATNVNKMLQRIIGEDIRVAVVVANDVGAVKADVSQMEQVLLNLVVNARDAMPRGGQLTIEVRDIDLDDTYVHDHPDARVGAHVLLSVSDTGCGMDQQTMTRIFEPFFTTKGEKGTGLGLATVYGIVKQSGGHIAVYSEVGHGTTFKVYLPREPKQPLVRKSNAGLRSMPHGTETLLLLEDEEGVRSLTRHALEVCGYTVLEARDGAEGLRIAQEYAGQIDLLMTDVVMPYLGGREVAIRIAALRPGIKVLFLSGYTDDAVVRHGILESEVAFLQKPFSLTALATKVREVLDSR